MIYFLSLVLSFSASATTLEGYMRNREGVKKLEKQQYPQAYKSFLQALAEDPLNPEVQLNLGLTFEANEDFEKAEQAYRGALKLLPEPGELRFAALFNLAGALVKQKKIEEALGHYQECLEMAPESKEVKTNIELLWKGGGGGGDSQDKNDDKDKQGKKEQKEGEGQGEKDKQQPDQPKEEKKNKPRPFESKDLSQQDVKKILDEIKNQEQSIRAQEYERKGKDQGNAKDW